MKSLDNGVTWTEETMPELTFNSTVLLSVSGVNDKVVVVGENQVNDELLVFTGELLLLDVFFQSHVVKLDFWFDPQTHEHISSPG